MAGEVSALRRLAAPEDGALEAARSRAAQAMPVPSPETGAFLAWAAATTKARHAVEVGSGGGLTGLWLLRGMPDRGVLTSVEDDPHRHSLATSAFDDADTNGRVRAILGDPQQVLPRLSDGGYDLCLLQGRRSDYSAHLDHALRLLRPGGMLVARNVLDAEDAAALQEFVARVTEDEHLVSALLPFDGGLLVATVLDDEAE